MATPNEEQPAISAEQAATERNADFAAQLHEELLGLEDGNEQVSDDEDEEREAPTQPAGKKPVATEDKQVSAAKVLELLRAGDLNTLAKELGRDPKEFRVKNSQFIKLRRQAASSKSRFDEERRAIEQERQTVRQQRQNLEQTQARIFEAVKHIENEDWIAFLETATGRSFDEIQKQLVQSSLDPSAKEVRRLKAEQARLQQERADELRRQQEQQKHAHDQQARAQYMSQLRTELFEDEELGLAEFEDHPNMPRFLQAVFEQQQRSFDGDNVISVKKAAQRAIKVLLTEHNSWSQFVDRFGSGSAETPKSKTSEQGARTTSTSARGRAKARSVARSQGGNPADVRKMSHQELISHFASQMRAEHS